MENGGNGGSGELLWFAAARHNGQDGGAGRSHHLYRHHRCRPAGGYHPRHTGLREGGHYPIKGRILRFLI